MVSTDFQLLNFNTVNTLNIIKEDRHTAFIDFSIAFNSHAFSQTLKAGIHLKPYLCRPKMNV